MAMQLMAAKAPADIADKIRADAEADDRTPS